MKVDLEALAKGSEVEEHPEKWLCSACLSLDGKDSTALVPYARPATQLSIIAEKVTFDSIVYTDLFKAYKAPDMSYSGIGEVSLKEIHRY